MFTALLPSGFSLTQFLKTGHSNEVLVMQCFNLMAVALSFIARDLPQDLNKQAVCCRRVVIPEGP